MLIRQFFRFAAVGVVGFLIDAGILYVAVHGMHLGLYLGRAISFLTAVTAAWALNRQFAFRDTASRSRIAEWFRYLMSNAIGGSVNLGSYALLMYESPALHGYPTVGVAVGSVAGMLVNFTLMKLFVFRSQHPGAAIGTPR